MAEAGDEAAPAAAEERRWCVTGGVDKGGILVRTANAKDAPEADSRLETGALVRQKEVVGDKLHYERLTGAGPETGWVTIKLKDKVLMEEAPVFSPKEVEAGKEAGVYAPRPEPAEKGRKIRVLVLHGTCSNEKVMRSQLALCVKTTDADVEWVFAEGPVIIENPTNPIVKTQLETMSKFFPGATFRQWGDPLGEQLGWRRYDGFAEAVASVQKVLKEQGPVDCVMGFSQGANVLHAVAAQACLGKGLPFRCCIFLCVSKPGWVAQMPELFEYKTAMPALFVRAEKDVVSTGTPEVSSSFENPELTTHPGEHRPMPAKPPEQKELIETIRVFLEKNCRE